MRRDRRPHAVAWWIWGAGLALAALRTSNPVLLLALGAVAVSVGTVCRADAPWGRSLGTFVKIGIFVIVVRVALQVIFGERLPGTVLFTLPTIPLPGWAAGVSIGGPVTAQSLLVAFVGGLRLAVVLVAFGAVNSVASPRELLRSLPGILNEVAVAVTVGLCFVPEIMEAIARVRRARQLRGRPTTGVAGWRGVAIPVLEDALERSTQLAASMGARGFGRRGAERATAHRVVSTLAACLGALSLLVGSYGVLAGGSVIPLAWLITLCGAGLLVLGVLLGPRRAVRTRYRPAPFGLRSCGCALSGFAPAIAIGAGGVAASSWSPYPLQWPTVPIVALIGVAIAALPMVLDQRVLAVSLEATGVSA